MDDNAKELVARSSRLFDNRPVQLWQELAENFYPERAEFTQARNISDTVFAENLNTTEPVRMRRDLANAFESIMRRPGTIWGRLDVDDERVRRDSTGQAWLGSRTDIMFRAMYDPPAQFVRATKSGDHDYATFGQAVISAEPNKATARLRYMSHHLKDCAWCDNHDGETDTMFRRIVMSARQMMKFFALPGDVLHENVRKAMEKEPDKEFRILHIMMPADEYDYATRKRKPKQPFVSAYIDVENQHLIRELPAEEFRYVVPRWQMVSGTPFAVSPAAVVSLPDARMMQALAGIIREAGEKSIDPPGLIKEGAIISDINLMGSGLTWVDETYDYAKGKPFEPIPMGKDAGLGIHLMDRLIASQAATWYLDRLTLPPRSDRTAFEASILYDEYLRANIPLFQPYGMTFNAPLLDLTARILWRVGAFGGLDDVPDILRGRPLTFSFVNPLQDAVEKTKVMHYQSLVELTTLGQAMDPAIPASVDFVRAHRDAVLGSGAPADWLLEEKAAAEAAAALRQEQQMQKMAAMVGGGAQVAEQVGKAGQALAAAEAPPQQARRAA